MYRERASVITGAQVWTAVSDGTAQRVLPDGCMDLLWMGDELVVAGPDATAFMSTGEAGAVTTGLRFAPGAAPAVLGVPATELQGQRVPLSALWTPADVARAAEVVALSPHAGQALESLVVGSGRGSGAPDAIAAEVTRRARAGERVSAIASAVGLSDRQVHRRSLEWFGYGPKTLSRILRLVAALDLARSGIPLAGVAARCGYADQSHLAGDARALAGATLGELGVGGQST